MDIKGGNYVVLLRRRGEEEGHKVTSPHSVQYCNNITFHMNVQPDGEASGVRLGGRKWDTALD